MDLVGIISEPISYTGEITKAKDITGSINSTSKLNATISSSKNITGNINTTSITGNITTTDNIVGKVEIGNGTGDATAYSSDILDGKTAYARGTLLTGTIPINQEQDIELTTKAESYRIPIGYHNGSGKVGIAEVEQNKIIADNIKKDINILGVTGSYSGLDVSDTTATSDTVENGKVFYNANGIKTTGSYIWNWVGSKPELVEKVYDEEVALEDTGFATWTASTTATSMRATENVDTFVADMVNYEYLLRWQYRLEVVYNAGATKKAIPKVECTEVWQTIFKRPSNLANLNSGTFNGNVCATVYTAPLYNYYNTSGTETMTYSNSYGVYPSVTAATFSSSTSNTPTVTIKTPVINARCNSTYFATGRYGDIDQTNTKYHLVCELYRIPIGGTLRSFYNNLVDTYSE